MSGIASGDVQKTAIHISTVLYQVGFTGSIALIALTSFGYLHPKFKALYSRRSGSAKFPRLPKSFRGWMTKVWREPDETILQKCGLDALMFIKLIRLNLTYALTMTLPAIILIFLNLFGGSLEDVAKDGWKNINLSVLTFSNVTKKNFFWAHIVTAWFSAVVLAYLFFKNNLQYIRLRQLYFASKDYQSQLHNSTLLLTHIPDELRSDTSLTAYMRNLSLLYTPTFCTLGRRVGHLPQLVREYNLTIRDFEGVLARFASSSRDGRPKHHVGRFGWLGIGTEVDSLDFYTTRLTELREEILELRGLSRDSLPVTGVGFAIYPDVHSAHIAARQVAPGPGTKLTGSSHPTITLSPSPDDLIWSNLLLTRRQQSMRWFLFSILFVGMVVGGASLFALMGTISNISLLKIKYPAAAALFTNNSVNALLDSTIAPAIMIVMIFIVQVLLRRLSEAQSAPTRSSVERRLLAKFLTFLVCDNLVIFSTLTALPSIRDALSKTQITDFQTFVIFLKTFVPSYGIPFSEEVISTASFWSSQMCIRTLSYMVELLQPVSLLRYVRSQIRSRGSARIHGLATTTRDQRELLLPKQYSFPIGYALQSFNLTLLMVFGIVAPTMIFFGIANFAVAYLVYKHQFMYVNAGHDDRPDSGGRLYATTFHGLTAIWIFTNFLLVLFMMFKGATNEQWYVILPLPFLVVIFGLAHRSWLDSQIDYLELGPPESTSYSTPTVPPRHSHRLSAHPTGQEVEMTYILPHQGGNRNSVDYTHSINSSTSHVGEMDSLTSPSRSNGGSPSGSFSHHPAFVQELLTLECDSDLFDLFPELRPFAVESNRDLVSDPQHTNSYSKDEQDPSRPLYASPQSTLSPGHPPYTDTDCSQPPHPTYDPTSPQSPPTTPHF